MKLFCQWLVMVWFLFEICHVYSIKLDGKDNTPGLNAFCRAFGFSLVILLGYSIYTAGAWSLILQ